MPEADDRDELLAALDEAEREFAVGRTVPYSALRPRLVKWAASREHADWLDFSAVSFGQFFDDTEVEYTEDDLPSGAPR